MHTQILFRVALAMVVMKLILEKNKNKKTPKSPTPYLGAAFQMLQKA